VYEPSVLACESSADLLGELHGETGDRRDLFRAGRAERPDAAEPCEERPLPRTGGIGGFLQDRTLELLDTAACRLGSSREQLVLALADDEERRRFEAEHGVDPRSVSGVLRALLG